MVLKHMYSTYIPVDPGSYAGGLLCVNQSQVAFSHDAL